MRKPWFEIYPSADRWWWRLRAANGRIIADGSEGYDSRRNVLRAIATVRATLGKADVRQA
jgi:uncharacterized protein YegP (UPF0339 family)